MAKAKSKGGKVVMCPNGCGAQMQQVTLREWIAAWTGYCCPNHCCSTTESTLTEPVVAEAETVAPAKKKRGKQATTAAAVIEDVEVEESDG